MIQSVNASEAAMVRDARIRWQDPVVFAHEALGIERTWGKQDELLRAIFNPDYKRIAVKSGQKTSKTFTIAIAAIIWALLNPRSKVVLIAPAQNHLETQLWPEFVEIRRLAEVCGFPIGGNMHKSAAAGWHFDNGSMIKGWVSDNPNNLRGISGHNNVYFIDEASEIAPEMIRVVQGNCMGGGKVVVLSNPLRATGWFFDCFAEGSPWRTVTISSLDAAAVTPPIPGLATAESIEAFTKDNGTDSAEYFSKILGEFPPEGSDVLISRLLVQAAQKRWTEQPTGEDEDSPLYVGCDPAHEGRDKTSIIVSRGYWSSRPTILEKFGTNDVTDKILELVQQYARPGERARVCVDGSSVGAGVADNLRDYHSSQVLLINTKAAERSPDPTCSRLRDAMMMNLLKWLQEGGSIPPDDTDLADDLCAPRRGYDEQQRWKIEDKRALRKRIGRSTDRADSLALSVWRPPPPIFAPIKRDNPRDRRFIRGR